jgi:FixJ family two-component response regulator
VFSLLVTGMANKEMVYKLGTSERTVKAHRVQVMEKMNAGSLADLVHFGLGRGMDLRLSFAV